MLAVFKEELQAKERCSFPGSMSASSSRSLSEELYSTSNLHQQQVPTRKRSCLYCNDYEHSASQCGIVTDIKTRLTIIRRNKRCFVCLRPDHIAKNCRSNYRCNKCQKKHHISICDSDTRNTTVDATENVPTTQATTCGNVAASAVLLQTGRAQVSNADDVRCSAYVRFLFDGGSMRSYVTDDLRKKLKMKTLRSERLVVSTFGTDGSDVKQMDVVQLKVKTLTEACYIHVEALVVPVICAPLHNQRPKLAKSQYAHLENLFLSDFVDREKMSIDVLIGADHYS